MSDYSELKKTAEACDASKCADESEYGRRLAEFFDECEPEDILALIAENKRLAEKIEQVRSRSVSLDYSKDAVIPNALDAWGRVVPQHLPYDFSGNPGASATQYCNGWNDSGGYWKAHCVDIQEKHDRLKAENEALRKDAERYRYLKACNGGSLVITQLSFDEDQERVLVEEEADQVIDAAMGKGEQS